MTADLNLFQGTQSMQCKEQPCTELECKASAPNPRLKSFGRVDFMIVKENEVFSSNLQDVEQQGERAS